jgi:hypothetical protein
MRQYVWLMSLLLCLSFSVLAQSHKDYCHVYLMDVDEVEKARESLVSNLSEAEIKRMNEDLAAGKKVGGVSILGRFQPTIDEEVLTTKNYPIAATKLFVTVSVFYTDESMHSSKTGTVESVLLGIAVSNQRQKSAFDVLSNATVEATYTEYTDTLRQKTTFKINERSHLVGLECRFHREYDETDPAAKKPEPKKEQKP